MEILFASNSKRQVGVRCNSNFCKTESSQLHLQLQLQSQLQFLNNAEAIHLIYILAENFFFNFGLYKMFSYLFSFTNFSSTEFMFSFALFSHIISNISRNISTVLFSSSLKRLNTFSQQKFVLIGIAQNLSSGLI